MVWPEVETEVEGKTKSMVVEVEALILTLRTTNYSSRTMVQMVLVEVPEMSIYASFLVARPSILALCS